MGIKSKMALYPLGAIFIVVLIMVVYFFTGILFRTHPAPECNIGNNFNQTVTVYVEEQKMVKIGPGDSKKFYPWEAISTPKENSQLRDAKPFVLLELKSNSGEVLYSRLFTHDEFMEFFRQEYQSKIRWIGD